MLVKSVLPKTALAKQLGVARSSLYYHPKTLSRDWALKQQIEVVLHDHPSYGHRRIAWELGFNKKRIRRVMRKFGLQPYRRRGWKYRKIRDCSVKYSNLLLTVTPRFPHHIWVSDFTRLGFHGRVLHLATVMDIYTRQVVGVSLLTTPIRPNSLFRPGGALCFSILGLKCFTPTMAQNTKRPLFVRC